MGGLSYVYGLTDKGVGEYGGKTLDDHSIRTLDHELEISFFHIELTKYCKKHAIELKWIQRDLKTESVHPDAQFSIKTQKGWFHFFLEIERAKNSKYIDGEPSIIRKLGMYYDYYGSKECEKDWDFKQFRTIVVLRNDIRRENLLEALHEKFNHRMFWLSTEEDHLTFKTSKDKSPVTLLDI